MFTKPTVSCAATGGNSGRSSGIITVLYDSVLGCYTGNSVPDIEQSCYNHLLVFAAEESRRNNTVVDIEEFVSNITD